MITSRLHLICFKYLCTSHSDVSVHFVLSSIWINMQAQWCYSICVRLGQTTLSTQAGMSKANDMVVAKASGIHLIKLNLSDKTSKFCMELHHIISLR